MPASMLRVARSALALVAAAVWLLAAGAATAAAAGTVTIVGEANPVNRTLQFRPARVTRTRSR